MVIIFNISLSNRIKHIYLPYPSLKKEFLESNSSINFNFKARGIG